VINQKFDYFQPASTEEALKILQEKQSEAKLLAGGTDLLVQIQNDLIKPKCLVSMKNLPLSYINQEKDGVRIGSATNINEISNSELIRNNFIALCEAASMIGATQIRNRGTLGGNLCNAAPSADTAPPLLVMNTIIEATSVNGKKTISIDKFFTGPRQTVLNPDELITSIFIPSPKIGTSTAYVKFRRTVEDIALIGVAVLLNINQNGKINEFKVAIGAAAPTPVRAYNAEEMVKGLKVSDLNLEEICESVLSATRPIDDVRASASYRQSLVKILTKRAIKLAMERNPFVKFGGRSK